jgi:hypothetical protein
VGSTDDRELSADPMLRLFVHLMNQFGTELGISLLVGGSWVSGVLVSPRVYTREVGDAIVAKAGEAGAGVREFFNQVGRIWFPSESEIEAENGSQEPPPEDERPVWPYHIHLRNARVFSGGDPVPVDGFYMRVRLDHVGGWTIGELGAPGYRSAGPPQPLGS